MIEPGRAPCSPADGPQAGEDGLETARRLEDEATTALCAHAADCGAAARARHGEADAPTIDALLADEFAVRFPTELRFDAAPLEAGEFAVALPKGDSATAGYVLFVHPFFRDRTDDLPWLVAYHLVTINYGEAACAEAAEAFGAALMGVSTDIYYQRICALADELQGSSGLA